MNPDLEHLIVLQAQDLDLARLRSELAEAPRRVKAAEGVLAAAERALASCRERLAGEEKLRRGQELEIETHRSKLVRVRRSLDGATSAQQVAAFEHEITFAEAAIGTLEDEEFASMERTEALEAEQTAASAKLARATEALSSERGRAVKVKLANTEAVAGLEQEREALRAQIAAPWLATYDKLARTRGTTVAEAIGTATLGKCAACQMGVRPQRWQDLIGREHESEIFHCESCGRLLFWDPRRDNPQTWAAGDRLQAAQAAQASARPTTAASPGGAR